MKKLYSIGETSKINSVSVQALRLYDKMGLLKPAYINKENGYRYYKPEQFLYIDIIKYSNYIKIPLKNLTKLFESKTPNEIKAILLEQSTKIKHEISYLYRVNKDIKAITDRLDSIDNNNIMEITTIHQDEISISTHSVSDNAAFQDVDYEMRRVEMDMFKKHIEYGSLSGAIYDLDFNSKKAFISLEKVTEGFEKIEEGEYLTIAFNIRDFDKAKEMISNYIKENNIKVDNKYYLIQHITMSFYYLYDLMIKIKKD